MRSKAKERLYQGNIILHNFTAKPHSNQYLINFIKKH